MACCFVVVAPAKVEVATLAGATWLVALRRHRRMSLGVIGTFQNKVLS